MTGAGTVRVVACPSCGGDVTLNMDGSIRKHRTGEPGSRQDCPAGGEMAAPEVVTAGYMRAFRAANPGYAERERRRNAARNRALEEIARRHEAEFDEIYCAELAAGGVEPPSTERECPCGGVIYRKSTRGRWPATCGQCPAEERAGAA